MSKRIGDMDDTEARLTMLRAFNQALGVIPESAWRWANGGYTVSLHLDLNKIARIPCSECGHFATHNYHRPDAECEDREAHIRDAPYQLHHPFTVGAQQQ